MAAEGIPVEVACRVLEVSVSGYYAWLSRPPSARAIRHAWLTDLITEVHQDSRGVYGSRRVHAELRLGRGIVVGHGAVELLMRRAGIVGVMGRPKWRRTKPDQIATDLVNRDFTRRRTEPQVAHRHHRASHSRGQGLLRGRARRLFTPRGRLVDRLFADGGVGDQRARHGHRQPSPRARERSSTPIKACSMAPGLSPSVPRTPGSFRRWAVSVTATTTR